MNVKYEQIPNTIRFLQVDLPALVLQTAGIEESDEYWQQVTEQVHIMSDKYQKNGFVDHMLLAYAEYLEKMYRRMQEIKEEREKNVI